jgi:hypothetical protein
MILASERRRGLTVLTLKAAGMLELDAVEIVRPGVLRIEGDRIASRPRPLHAAGRLHDRPQRRGQIKAEIAC